jgi:hypothetical protein
VLWSTCQCQRAGKMCSRSMLLHPVSRGCCCILHCSPLHCVAGCCESRLQLIFCSLMLLTQYCPVWTACVVSDMLPRLHSRHI